MSDCGRNPSLNDGTAAPFRGKEQQDADPVLAFAMQRFSSEAEALKWCRTQKPMPGYGDKTPEELVREGCGEGLLQTLKAIEAGDVHW